MLGQGGVACTWLGRDPLLARQVIVKTPRPELDLSPVDRESLVERLRLRTRSVAALSHPAVVVVHDIGDDEKGPFFVFEMMKGRSLRAAVSSHPLGRSEVAPIARALGSALSYAHAAGVVHGDLKPENVVLTPHGPKLVDFGFAEDRPVSAYAAPESHESAAADQFSLAAILYEALTGRAPFEGSDADALAAAVRGTKHPTPTSVAPALRLCPHVDTIFDRALAKSPLRRFPTCEAFGAALAGSLESAHEPVLTPISQSSIIPRTTRRWHNAVAAAGALVIFLLALFGRQPRGQGVSLKSVAAAFATAVGGAHSVTRRVRPAAPTPGRPLGPTPVSSQGFGSVAPALIEAGGRDDP